MTRGDLKQRHAQADAARRSDDHGQNFSRVAGFAPSHVSLVLIDPRGGRPGTPSNTLWVGSHDQPGLWLSQDGGQRFERVAALPAQAPQRAAFGPDGVLYVSLAQGDGTVASNPGQARSGSVWRRDPDGRWTDITPLRPGTAEGRGFGYAGLDVDAQRPGRLIVATIERWSEGDELFVSEDGGGRWTALASRDRGRSWAACAGWPGGAGQCRLVPVADPQVEGVFYVHEPAAGRILVSVDGGLSFTPAITGLPRVEPWQGAQLVCAPGRLRDLWLALPQGLVHLAGVDEPARPCRDVLEARQVAIGQAAPGAAYHSVYVWGRVRVDGSADGLGVEGLFRSDDAGARFQRIDDDRHRYGRLLALAADPLEHGTVYLAPHGRGVIVGQPRLPAAAPKVG